MKSVEVKNLTVQFGAFKAVDDMSFSVERGEIFGFLGANGAGKTTTIRVICGLLEPTKGWVRVSGENFKDNGENIKSKVGYMSQKFTLYNDLTVDENLSFTASLRSLRKDYFNFRKKYLLDFIKFNYPTNTLVRDLPGGIKQQVSLAASILHDPDVIFLDEPTAGVTPVSRARFWSLIKDLAKNEKTIFVTSHYMDEVEQCGRIALMRTGKLIALGSSNDLKREQFPFGMYELTSNGNFSAKIINDFKNSSYLASFQPYGHRFHASPSSVSAWENVKTDIEKYFEVKEILPTLEDVFIKLVEGKNR